MLVNTILSVLVLSLSVVAQPVGSSTADVYPAIGSTIDYSNIEFLPLQAPPNGSVLSSDPVLGGFALRRRQDINFELVDSAPDPTIAPNNYTDYNQQAAIDAVIASVDSNPLPQKRDAVVTSGGALTGYSGVALVPSAAINAPLNCNGDDTFMGARLFSSGPFDPILCAAACTAQNAYNLKHPPRSGSPKLCQFYNTYVLLKDGASQGQYW